MLRAVKLIVGRPAYAGLKWMVAGLRESGGRVVLSGLRESLERSGSPNPLDADLTLDAVQRYEFIRLDPSSTVSIIHQKRKNGAEECHTTKTKDCRVCRYFYASKLTRFHEVEGAFLCLTLPRYTAAADKR